jgi:hypothetical protein
MPSSALRLPSACIPGLADCVRVRLEHPSLVVANAPAPFTHRRCATAHIRWGTVISNGFDIDVLNSSARSIVPTIGADIVGQWTHALRRNPAGHAPPGNPFRVVAMNPVTQVWRSIPATRAALARTILPSFPRPQRSRLAILTRRRCLRLRDVEGNRRSPPKLPCGKSCTQRSHPWWTMVHRGTAASSRVRLLRAGRATQGGGLDFSAPCDQ